MKEVKREMKPELINRIDEVIVFHKLNDNENDLRAALKYYNDSATEINHLIHHFPSNLLKLVNHYEDIELYTFKKQDRFELLTEQ